MYFSLGFLIAALLLSVVFVEGATELARKGVIFDPLRRVVTRVRLFELLLGCGYCTSVWVAMLPAALVFIVAAHLFLYEKLLLFVFFTVVLHRLSNYLHNFNDKHLDKYYDVETQRLVREVAKEIDSGQEN